MFNLFRLFYKQRFSKICELNSLKFNLAQRAGLNYFSLILLFSLLLFALACNTTEPPIIPPPPPVVKDTITVSIEGFTHRSITLSVKCTINNVQSSIKLFRQLNGTAATVTEYSILVKDTTITDDDNGTGLLLDTTYTYFAVRVDSLGQFKDTSSTVTQKTLAPTSHNYTWQVFTIGDAGFNNSLYDVWGTYENNVYAVGILSINGKDYSVLHFDGSTWIPLQDTVGGTTIYGFNSNDIWIAGGGVYWYNGTKWKRVDAKVINNQSFPLDSVLYNNSPYTSIWGTSSSNLYLGNAWGKIIHWDGSKASVVSENNTKPLNDMEGFSSDFIIAVGVDFSTPSAIKYFNGNSWNNFQYVDNNKSLNGVTIVNPFEIYWAGEGIYKNIRENFTEVFHSGYYIWDIEYNKFSGEVVAAGAFDGVYVYDGVTWNDFRGVISNDETTYSGIYLSGRTIFCAGRNDNQAKIIIGKR